MIGPVTISVLEVLYHVVLEPLNVTRGSAKQIILHIGVCNVHHVLDFIACTPKLKNIKYPCVSVAETLLFGAYYFLWFDTKRLDYGIKNLHIKRFLQYFYNLWMIV